MQKTIYICLMTLFFSLSAFAGTYDEYGYNNSSYGSPMYNTGAMGGGTYWSQLATDFYTQSNAVTPYSYSQTIETKVQTSDQGIRVVGDKPASTPTTVVKKDVEQSRATGWDVWLIYPATTITSTREQTVNIAQANTTVLSTYGPNTYFNFNVYNPAQQNYAYNTYQATSTGPVLVASATQSGPPPMSVQYTAIPRSVSTGPLDASPGSKFQTAVQLYNQQTLTLSEANKVIVDFIDRVIPDATNGRVQYIGNVISKVTKGLPPDQSGQAANLLKEYMTGEASINVGVSDGIPPNNFEVGKNNIFTASGAVSGKQGADGYFLQLEIDGVLRSPSQLLRTTGTLSAFNKIAAFYAKSKGYTGTVKTVNTLGDKQGNDVAFYGNGVLTVRAIAFTEGKFDNVNDFKSTINHEVLHWKDPKTGDRNYQFKDHANIYLLEASDPDFKNCSNSNKVNNANQYMIRIINSSKANEVGMNNSGIIAAINKYNSDNKGGVLMYDYLFSSAGVDKLTFKTSINGIKIKDNYYEYQELKKTTD